MKTTSVLVFASAAPLALAAEPTCTANLVTKVCGYENTVLAAAEGSREGCYELCDSEKYGPCKFAIFSPGNPYLGDGTCWLYPDESFDPAKEQDKGCGNPYLEVYDKITCQNNPKQTPTALCPAAASPTPVAKVCGYKAPEDCDTTCIVSTGQTDCLNRCATADECAYVVFYTNNDAKSPWMSGNCWIYKDGKFDPKAVTACKDKPDQYVFDPACPKVTKTATASAAKETGSAASGSAAHETGSATSGAAAKASKTGESTSVPSAPRSEPQGNVKATANDRGAGVVSGVSLGLVAAAAALIL